LEDGALAAGNYADLYGQRKALLIGLIVFALALTACGVAATETPYRRSVGYPLT
jgi:MFS family permease